MKIPEKYREGMVVRVLKMQTKLRKGEITHKEYLKFLESLESGQ